jgi:hypothetical protein
LTLKISPRRTRNYATMRWLGTIAGGPYPASAISLLAQVREGRSWHTFAQIVTASASDERRDAIAVRACAVDRDLGACVAEAVRVVPARRYARCDECPTSPA